MSKQDNQSTCTQQTLMIKYEGNFEAEKPYELEVRHNNKSLNKSISNPDISDPNPRKTEISENQGVFSSIINGIKRFLGMET